MLIVPWQGRLTVGKMIGRRHRFLLDVELENGSKVVAHCVNPGRMEGLVRPGVKVWLSAATGKGRTLKWTWELVEIENTLICTNSWTANKLVNALLLSRTLDGMRRSSKINQESNFGIKTRFDFELKQRTGSHFIEAKSVQQVYGDGYGYFPDSKALRSCDHVRKLIKARSRGHKATFLAVVQRGDAKLFRPSELHDPEFAKLLRFAVNKGVKVRAILLEPTLRGFRFRGYLPVDLKPYDQEPLQLWVEKMKPFSGWSRPLADPSAGWRRTSSKRANPRVRPSRPRNFGQ